MLSIAKSVIINEEKEFVITAKKLMPVELQLNLSIEEAVLLKSILGEVEGGGISSFFMGIYNQLNPLPSIRLKGTCEIDNLSIQEIKELAQKWVAERTQS